MRSALVAGATGLVGGHVLDLLLADERWKRVVVLSRRTVSRSSEKVTERIVDFEGLAAADLAGVDDVFACLGTTIKVAGSKERFRRVDHDYTLAVATLAREGGAKRLALVSSIGASETASNFYLRVKGETERDVRAIGYDSLIIARPSMLVGARTENRPAERIGIAAAKAFAPLMLGGLRVYRPIEASVVARALVEGVAAGESGVRVLTHAELVTAS